MLASPFRHRTNKLGVGERTHNRRAEVVLAPHKDACLAVLDEIRPLVLLDSDDWHARSHCFEHNPTPRPVQHWLDKHIDVRVQLRKVMPKTRENEAAPNPMGHQHGLCFADVLLITDVQLADHEEASSWQHLRHADSGLYKMMKPVKLRTGANHSHDLCFVSKTIFSSELSPSAGVPFCIHAVVNEGDLFY